MWSVAHCSKDIISVVLGPQRIQLALVEQHGPVYTVSAYTTFLYDTPITFANPTLLQHTIKTFLHQHNLANASVCIALDVPGTLHNIEQCELPPATPQGYAWRSVPLDQNNHHYVHTGIRQYHLAQGKLLAINTPFHCAGITTHKLSQLHAAQLLSSAWPVVTPDITAYISALSELIAFSTFVKNNSKHSIATHDLLSIIGLYNMARQNNE